MTIPIFLGGWLIGAWFAWLPWLVVSAVDVICNAYDRSPRGQRETRALNELCMSFFVGPYRDPHR